MACQRTSYPINRYGSSVRLAVAIPSILMMISACASAPVWSDAAQRGDDNTARSLILRNNDLKSTNIYGDTPLIWAAKTGDDSFVSKLIELGAGVNEANLINGETPLIAAAKKGRTAVVALLVKNGANIDAVDRVGNNAVAAAVAAGKTEVLTFLLKHGSIGDTKNIESLFISSARSGEIALVEEFLRMGANVNHQDADGESALMAAVKSGKIDVVRLLLKRGANLDSSDSTGRTPLIHAAQSGCVDTCEELISAGADVNAIDSRGNTPLMWSILMGHQNVTLQLIEKNADVSIRNAANKNALYMAAFTPETVRQLIQKNARIVEIKIENNDYHDSALRYQWLAEFIEKEMFEGRLDTRVAAREAGLAYEISARFFDVAANQYAEITSKLRTEQIYNVASSVILTALSIAVASTSARLQAQASAEVSALKSLSSGGSGHGVGYGGALYQVATPNNASLREMESQFETLTTKVRNSAISCRKKATCYKAARAGEEQLCLKSFQD